MNILLCGRCNKPKGKEITDCNCWRPLKFETVEELESKIADYLEQTPKEEWTITGLAIALDTYRSVLCDYEEKDEYSNTIKRAKQMVEHSYELDLKKHGRTGTIFALKNFDWKDRNETDLTSLGKQILQWEK